jgi:hypothetical protein
MTESRAIQEAPAARPAPALTAGAAARGLVPTNLDEVLRLARIVVGAGYLAKVPGDAQAMAAMIIMKGLELGMSPSVALDSIAIINGRTCVWGKAVPALVRRAGHKIREWETGTRMQDDWTFHCEITRGDTGEVITRSFSVEDARQAGLWNQEAVITRQGRDGPYTKANDSPWRLYPQRMLPARAKGYAAADGAPEALLGMYTAEEMEDVVRAEAESRGEIVTAPPPPPLELPQPAPAPDDELLDMGIPGPEPAMAIVAARDEPIAAPETQPDASDHIKLKAVSCAQAMAKATTIERLDKLITAFNEKFTEQPRAISTQLEMLYEQNRKRIEEPEPAE